LGDLQLALPAAIYSVCMYITATAFGLFVLRRKVGLQQHAPADTAVIEKKP